MRRHIIIQTWMGQRLMYRALRRSLTEVKDHLYSYAMIRPCCALVTKRKHTAAQQKHGLYRRNGRLIQCLS